MRTHDSPAIFDLGEKARERGASFLLHRLHVDAGFQSTAHMADGSPAHFPGLRDGEVFTSSVVLKLLSELPERTRLKGDLPALISGLTEFLLPYSTCPRVSFFRSLPEFPPDIDTTGLLMSSLFQAGKIRKSELVPPALEVLGNCDAEKIMNVYWDTGERALRYDPVAVINALQLAHLSGFGGDARALCSERYAFGVLAADKHLEGSRYYTSPITHIFFASGLASTSEDIAARWGHLIVQKVNALTGKCNSPIDLAMYISSFRRFGWATPREKERLLSLQQEDGGWPHDYLYCSGRTPKIYFGGRELTTAFALHALRT